MIKRTFDLAFAAFALLLSAPFVLIASLAILIQDRRSPWYKAERIGLHGRPFTMFKLRSMSIDADQTGMDSTAHDDPRITAVGSVCRKIKLDEVPQFLNVLKGDMSVVGPRPQVRREVDRYTKVEVGLLAVRPGVTDYASIVFADLGRILESSVDANLTYNQLVRPWKSRLGLFYIHRRSMRADIRVIWLTLMSSLSRKRALRGVQHDLQRMGAPENLARVAARRVPLVPTPPPGSSRVVERLEGGML